MNQLSGEIQALVTFRQRQIPKLAPETINERTNIEAETRICTLSNLLIFGTTTKEQHERALVYTLYTAQERCRRADKNFHLPTRYLNRKLLKLPILSNLMTNVINHDDENFRFSCISKLITKRKLITKNEKNMTRMMGVRR